MHVDGSCNGLQHYAALARDEHIARCVNLEPGHTVADAYSDVAAAVHALIEREYASRWEARAALPYVNRKLVKQTVMTRAYGVTLIGAVE